MSLRSSGHFSIILFICLFICLCIHSFIHLTVYLFIVGNKVSVHWTCARRGHYLFVIDWFIYQMINYLLYLSVFCLFICLYIHSFVHLSVYSWQQGQRLTNPRSSGHFSIILFICLFICLCIHSFVHLSVYLSIVGNKVSVYWTCARRGKFFKISYWLIDLSND